MKTGLPAYRSGEEKQMKPVSVEERIQLAVQKLRVAMVRIDAGKSEDAKSSIEVAQALLSGDWFR